MTKQKSETEEYFEKHGFFGSEVVKKAPYYLAGAMVGAFSGVAGAASLSLSLPFLAVAAPIGYTIGRMVSRTVVDGPKDVVFNDMASIVIPTAVGGAIGAASGTLNGYIGMPLVGASLYGLGSFAVDIYNTGRRLGLVDNNPPPPSPA